MASRLASSSRYRDLTGLARGSQECWLGWALAAPLRRVSLPLQCHQACSQQTSQGRGEE